MIVDSIADLCDPDKMLYEVLPTMNREDDTEHDVGAWIKAQSEQTSAVTG
jgi:hypothetical protein